MGTAGLVTGTGTGGGLVAGTGAARLAGTGDGGGLVRIPGLLTG